MAGLTAGLTLPGGVLAAHAQTTAVAVEALADECGVALTSDAPLEVLLAVSWVPQEVVLAQGPVVEPSPAGDAVVDPEASSAADASASPTAELTASPARSADTSPSPDPLALDPAVLAVGPEPLPVPLVPADGAGAEDAYRVVLTDAVTLAPLLELELALPLCAAPDPVPSASPTLTTTPIGAPTSAASGQTPGPTPLPDPTAPPATAPTDPAPVTAATDTSGPLTTPALITAPPSVGMRSFGRLSALRGTSRPGLPSIALLPTLPELAVEAAAVPTPVLAYPPGTTGVVLPAPPDRPLAVLQPLLPGAGSPHSTPPAQVVLTGAAPPEGIAAALPPALLVAAAAAGFLATQLRRRVPIRRP